MNSLSIPIRYTCTGLLISAATLAVAAGFQAAKGTAPDVRPSSIQQTMDLMIDPSADSLWDSVGTEETAKGTQVKAPKTDADWLKVTGYAQTLIAGAKNLQKPGLPVGQNAHSKLADADTPGTRTAVQIRKDIDADPARFHALAGRLEEASNHALSASRSHNASGVLSAGAELDAACEACHAAYWYPRTQPLHLPSADEFQKKAIGHR